MPRRILKPLLCLLVPAALVYAYYWHYERFSQSLIREQHMHYETANAVKHAYAAAQAFSFLRYTLGENSAETAVLLLGNLNEHFEQVMRIPKDSAPEVLRDLSNNQIGITAARWHMQHNANMSLRSLLIDLADKNVMLTREQSMHMPAPERVLKGQFAVRAAAVAFQKMRATLIQRTERTLVKL